MRRGGAYSSDLIDQIVDVTGDLSALSEGVLEVGSKLADYASDFFLQGGNGW